MVLIFLLVLKLILLFKLQFFLPQLSGATSLFDFDAYYYHLRAILAGTNPYLFEGLKTQGPPLVFLYYLPFNIWGIHTARTIHTFVNLLTGYLSVYLLARHWGRSQILPLTVLFSLILFSSFPVRLSLILGQPNLVVMLLVTLIFTSPKLITKSLALSSLVAIKTNFLLLLTTLIRKKRMLGYVILFLGVLFLLSLNFLDLNDYYSYLKSFYGRLEQSGIEGTDYYNQSIRSTFHRLGFEGNYFPLYIVLLLLGVIYLTVSGNILAAVILSLILSPVSWQHYYSVLFPLYIVLWMKGTLKSPVRLVVFITSFFFWWVEFPWLHTQKLTNFNGILASHYLLSAVLLFGLSLKQSVSQMKKMLA